MTNEQLQDGITVARKIEDLEQHLKQVKNTSLVQPTTVLRINYKINSSTWDGVNLQSEHLAIALPQFVALYIMALEKALQELETELANM